MRTTCPVLHTDRPSGPCALLAQAPRQGTKVGVQPLPPRAMVLYSEFSIYKFPKPQFQNEKSPQSIASVSAPLDLFIYHLLDEGSVEEISLPGPAHRGAVCRNKSANSPPDHFSKKEFRILFGARANIPRILLKHSAPKTLKRRKITLTCMNSLSIT